MAAAATVALIAGAVVINVNRESTSSSSVDGQPVGLFPAGDPEQVVAFRYTGPADVAVAYLSDRLAEYGDLADVTVSMWRPTLIEEDRTVVQFHVWEENASRTTGEVLVERVSGGGGRTGWAVMAAMIRLGDLQRVSFVDGTVEGEFASTGDGTRTVTVHDAVTGEPLVPKSWMGPGMRSPMSGETAS